jgi:preprotein translocase subunit SecE
MKIMVQLWQFLKEVKGELSKVAWPSRSEFLGSTVVVFILVCLFAIYLGSIDYGLSQAAKYLFTKYGH